MALYFAYGSNMWRHQMLVERCPGAKFTGVGLLRGWRFLINARGVATIFQEAASSVWGVVWDITPEHERTLDGYEGVPDWYHRETVGVHLPGRGEVPCLTYVDRSPDGGTPGPPREGYLEKILAGAAEHGLPKMYVAEISSFAKSVED
jgi:cation transport regulator ChaC